MQAYFLFGMAILPIVLVTGSATIQSTLKVELGVPTGKRSILNLQKPKPEVLHSNLKYLTLQVDDATGRVYAMDRSPSQNYLNQVEDARIDYKGYDMAKISKTKERKHLVEGKHDLQQSSAGQDQTSFTKLERNYHYDYLTTNETLTYHNMLRDGISGSRDYVAEVAIVVDKEWADVFLHDRQKIVEYWAVLFWDINMRFKTLPSINISFRITSIIAIASFEAQPFIEETRDNDGIANFFGILGNFGRWMYDNSDTFPKFDIAMCVTNTKTDKYGGVAYLNGACRPKTNALLFNDEGDYTCLEAATHELGHSLGAPHDANDDFPGGCSSDGFIMSGNKGIGKYFFSECSDRTIYSYVTSDQAACLKRIDEPSYPVVDPQESTEYTPTMNEQCKALRRNDNAYVIEEQTWNCAQIYCWHGGNGINLRPVDNSPCLYGRCFRARCLQEGSPLRNVGSGECLKGKDRFSGYDDVIMGGCPDFPTPLEKFYANKTTSAYLLLTPYSAKEATENEDKCLQVSDEYEDIVNFVPCADAGQGQHEWHFEYVQDDIYLIKELSTQQCLKQEGAKIIVDAECDENDSSSLWYFNLSNEVK